MSVDKLFENENEVLSQAIIVAMHCLMDIAQQEERTEARLEAIWQILEYAIKVGSTDSSSPYDYEQLEGANHEHE